MQTTLENQTVNNRPVREEYIAPNVNIFETSEGYVLQAEMPGVGKDGLEITLEGTEITITGKRNPETVVGDTLFRERNTANYRRVFELDPAIDTAKVSAKIEQGVLTVTLPKSERVKPRKIAVD
jgi:HSP20 family protein